MSGVNLNSLGGVAFSRRMASEVIPSWRHKHMLGHRRAGRVYFVCCFAGSISGMTLSLSAQGGMVGKVRPNIKKLHIISERLLRVTSSCHNIFNVG